MKMISMVLLLLVTGCSTLEKVPALPSVKPIATVQLNYAFPFSVDYWVDSRNSWQCEQPQFRGELGLQTKSKWEFGVYHESMVLCGTWNKKPEIFENGAYIKKSWGGY